MQDTVYDMHMHLRNAGEKKERLVIWKEKVVYFCSILLHMTLEIDLI